MSLPYASALSPSVSQTEFNSHARREIHRLTLAFCRLEFDLLRCASCCFIQTVAQTAYHAVHLNAAAREEYHLENNVTFDLQSTPFRGVLRTWFVQDVNRRCSTFGGRGSLLGRFGWDRRSRRSALCSPGPRPSEGLRCLIQDCRLSRRLSAASAGSSAYRFLLAGKQD